MKKSVLIIFLLFTIFLASCSDETIYSHDYREEYGFIMGSVDWFIYDEYYFSMHKGNDIYYQNAENPIEGGMSVFADPLSEADANNNPLNIFGEICMLVDPYSTERNNNSCA